MKLAHFLTLTKEAAMFERLVAAIRAAWEKRKRTRQIIKQLSKLPPSERLGVIAANWDRYDEAAQKAIQRTQFVS